MVSRLMAGKTIAQSIDWAKEELTGFTRERGRTDLRVPEPAARRKRPDGRRQGGATTTSGLVEVA